MCCYEIHLVLEPGFVETPSASFFRILSLALCCLKLKRTMFEKYKPARLVFSGERRRDPVNKAAFILLSVCFFFATLLPVFYFLAILGESQVSAGLQLMTGHVCKHHSATKAWKNDRSAFQYVLTNKLVRRCRVLHNRCAGCRGMEPVIWEEKRKWPCPIWA